MAETETPGTPRASRTVLLALLAVVLAAGLAALSWLDARHRIATTQEELARRLREIESDSREARLVSRQAQEAVRESQGRVASLEARLAESQGQQLALEALYQDLSRNRDEWQLAEIEQVLAIASQQLQLARNVRAAILALQLAEARLSRTDRPQFAPIRRALARSAPSGRRRRRSRRGPSAASSRASARKCGGSSRSSWWCARWAPPSRRCCRPRRRTSCARTCGCGSSTRVPRSSPATRPAIARTCARRSRGCSATSTAAPRAAPTP